MHFQGWGGGGGGDGVRVQLHSNGDVQEEPLGQDIAYHGLEEEV